MLKRCLTSYNTKSYSQHFVYVSMCVYVYLSWERTFSPGRLSASTFASISFMLFETISFKALRFLKYIKQEVQRINYIVLYNIQYISYTVATVSLLYVQSSQYKMCDDSTKWITRTSQGHQSILNIVKNLQNARKLKNYWKLSLQNVVLQAASTLLSS